LLTSGPDSTGVPGAPPLELIPLGGLGEFGMNMMLVACGDTAVIIDAGVMSRARALGVDLIIPDVRQLRQCGSGWC
jgi:ribonuclease J